MKKYLSKVDPEHTVQCDRFWLVLILFVEVFPRAQFFSKKESASQISEKESIFSIKSTLRKFT